jgi:hypothetical protein
MSGNRPDPCTEITEEAAIGIEDMTAKAREHLSDSRVTDALKSEQAESISETVLDGVTGVANKVTGGGSSRSGSTEPATPPTKRSAPSYNQQLSSVCPRP